MTAAKKVAKKPRRPSPAPEPRRHEHLLSPKEVQEGARFSFTDDGNASRFAEDHADRLMYSPGPGWHRWNGKRWRPIPKDGPLKEARDSARRIRKEALKMTTHEWAIMTVSWSARSSSSARLSAMVKLAESGDPSRGDLTVPVEKLDGNPDVLNTPSGIVDLRTGELRSSDRDERCTRLTRAAYDPDADQSRWLRFLERIVPDPDVRSTLQRCLGASITGNVPKALFLLYGKEGDNGKTQLIEAINAVLGDYAGTALESTFTNANSREAGYDFATLRGSRFVSFSETRDDKGLAAERVKRLTGGDTVAARQIYEKPFRYKAQFSLWLATNHPPIIPAREKAMWKRVWAFPFDVVIPKREQIPDLGELLAKKHGPAILAWLVEGAQLFYAEDCRLGVQPAAMEQFRDVWRDRDDIVKRWLEEETEAAAGGRVRFADLWNAFREWCEHNGEQTVLRTYTSQKFHAEMDDHYPRGEGVLKGSAVREGLVLVTPEPGSRITLGGGRG